MKKDIFIEVARTLKKAQSNLENFTPAERAKLEKGWDFEHAYYSSALSGNTVDRDDFERLSKSIK